MADLAILELRLIEIRDLIGQLLSAQIALIDALAAEHLPTELGERDQTEEL